MTSECVQCSLQGVCVCVCVCVYVCSDHSRVCVCVYCGLSRLGVVHTSRMCFPIYVYSAVYTHIGYLRMYSAYTTYICVCILNVCAPQSLGMASFLPFSSRPMSPTSTHWVMF